MKMNMKNRVKEIIAQEKKAPLPLISFPSVSLMGISVRELISSPELQAKGMKLIADRHLSAASVSMMDLSVEAEAFGSEIRVSETEVPTVIGSIVNNIDEAESLRIPTVGEGRTGLYIEAARIASETITDRPVFAGMIGPFSLAGRLMDVNNALVNCYEEPELVSAVMEKTTAFLAEYAKAYKAAGANGIVMAEPLTGLLSPDLAEEFSEPYVRRIVEAVQDDEFIVIYHNCGNTTIRQIESILRTKAAGYHFGNAISMSEMMKHIPLDVIAMGNIDPAGEIRNGTPESVAKATAQLLEACSGYPNFVISTGCDVPPMSPWENIDMFFETVENF